MRKVTYSMGVSLDGYVTDPGGGFDWTTPSEEVFDFFLDELRRTEVQIMGRRLYDTMLYWETAEQDQDLNAAEREWAALWRALPKVVVSTTLTAVQGNTRLATGTLADEVRHWRDEPGDGDVAIGGAGLAAGVAADGLVDEYLLMVHPVLLGGGTPYFPRDERRVDLELVETRQFDSGALHLRYRDPRPIL